MCIFTYIGPSAVEANVRAHKHSAIRVYVHMCVVPRRHRRHPEHNANNNLSPSWHPSPRRFQQMLPDPRDPSLHGGLLVLSRRGRVRVFGAHNEPQGQVWTSLHGSWRARAPHERGRDTPPPRLLRSRRFPPPRLLLFFPRERLKTGVASPWRDFLPFDNWKSWPRATLPLPKGKTHGFVGGCSGRSTQCLAMLFGNTFGRRRCNRIFPIVGMSWKTWALFPGVKSSWCITVAVAL